MTGPDHHEAEDLPYDYGDFGEEDDPPNQYWADGDEEDAVEADVEADPPPQSHEEDKSEDW